MSSGDTAHNEVTCVPETASKPCQHCKRVLEIIEFGTVKTGTNKGQLSGTCKECSVQKAERQQRNQRELREAEKEDALQEVGPDELGTLALEDFLHVLQQQNDTLELEAEVDLNDTWGTHLQPREIADKLAELCWDMMNYQWLYHSHYEMQYRYHCAQSSQRIKKAEKKAPPNKQRNKLSMLSFKCNGWLYIMFPPQGKVAHVKLVHCEGHIPYCPIDIPPDAHQIVEQNAESKLSEIWKKILKKAIYQIWSSIDSKKWKRHKNELISAEMLLCEAEEKGLGLYKVKWIPVVEEMGLTVIAFTLPDLLRQWGDVYKSSRWIHPPISILTQAILGNTNGSRYELFAVIGEAYGSGSPLGYLLVQSNGADSGAKQKVLQQLLWYLKKEWKAHLIVMLSDKDRVEINAFCAEFPEAKHQLCFWHAIKAICKCLSVLRRAPAYYNVDIAREEFHWIDKDFEQCNTHVVTTAIPRVTIRLNGVVVPALILEREHLMIHFLAPDCIKSATSGNSQSSVEHEDDALEVGERLPDEEKWDYEEGEKRVQDPNYVFCPAIHRNPLLHLFTQHFCQHPAFPEHDGKYVLLLRNPWLTRGMGLPLDVLVCSKDVGAMGAVDNPIYLMHKDDDDGRKPLQAIEA
ncbi:hypothetical protein NEOLEDRAFT_1153530 [Neolentinus lepideus HHB14362 ss-1]|uniref:MULE transposase domain-containing protein n=1 Tax=Neolentinus lepideus HHB14362 ss-1 TaxID=1314782 RepID=A0A165VVC4_9AGAM|nr:hypothetical protein NEOLEDRAFT_1153530 [Neolentinus lepideus HHB14362 ss-1]